MTLALAVLLASQVLAQSPAAHPVAAAPTPPLNAQLKPDRTPTAWACTVDTLFSGKDCLFEAGSEPVTDHAGQKAQNVHFAKQLAPAACDKAAKPAPGKSQDKALTELCQKEFVTASEACTLDGKAVLVDSEGRFSAGAQGCYRALSEVLQKSALMSSLASGCCRCMASRGCKVTANTCYQNISRGAPNTQERACMANSCAEECSDTPSSSTKPVEALMPTRSAAERFPAHEL